MLLAFSYPHFSFSVLAWVAFIPLLLELRHCASFKQAAVSAAIAGFVFFAISCYWTAHVTAVGAVLLFFYLALFFAPFGMGVYALYSKQQSAVLWGALFWTALEFLRGQLLGGFPWNLLASSQSEVIPLIQIASITGVYGVSFLIIMANLIVFEFGLWAAGKPLKASAVLLPAGAVLIFAAFAYGSFELRAADKAPAAPREPFKPAAVQPCVPQEQKWDPRHRNEILNRLRSLTLSAVAQNPQLVVWPETSVPGEIRKEAELRGFAEAIVEETGVPILIGSQDSDEKTPSSYYNSAVLVEKGRDVWQSYRKMHLVPFGEFLPGAKWFPFLRRFIPIPEDFSPGGEQTIFQLKGPSFSWREPDGTIRSEMRMMRFGVVICFEDVFPELFRQACLQGVNFMVNVTNDAWFQRSGASRQHGALAVFRCVENRVPLLRATNTGYTCFIDAYGRVTAHVASAADIFVPGFLTAEIPPHAPSKPLYPKLGDFFAHACLIMAIIKGITLRRK